MKINLNAQDKYPVSVNLLKSLRRFGNVMFQQQELFRNIAFKVSTCLMD